jgi:site-specific DNA-methyltransferase (adenine-specific)
MMNLALPPHYCKTDVMRSVLVHADCFDVFPYIADKSVNLILCDLPYGTTACKWDSILPFEKLWEHYNRVIKDNGVIILFGREPFSSKVRLSNEFNYRYDWIWEKSKATNFLFAKQMPLIAHEDIMIFYKKLPTYNPQKTKGKPYNKGFEKRNEIEAVGKIGNGNLIINESGERNPRSVIYFRTAESEGKLHPTQKPIELIEYLIKTYTNEGDMVLDNTMGSGTTNLACIKLNRKSIGIEKEKQYYDVAVRRALKYLGNDTYKNIQEKVNYDKLLSSGMFWEVHPELSGNWDVDREVVQYCH